MPAIWLLALDTSTPCTALALGRVDRDTGTHELVAHATHDDREAPASSLLAPRISALLNEVGISARQLGAVGCGVGPGMFTGTRVALATAKGLAFALPCPLFVVSTLAGVAGGAARDGEVLALLDARRGEVYAARFTLDAGGPRMQGEARCCPIGQVLSDMAQGPDLQVIGPGAAAQAEALVGYATWPTIGATGEGLWRAGVHCVVHEAPADLDNVDAVYLRASYAELGTHTPRRTPYRSPFA